MIICGVDPGTRATGYGILELQLNGSAEYIIHGTIRPRAKDLPGRLKQIYLELLQVFEHFKPQEVAVESSFYAKNAQTAMKLGQVRGVIILAATLHDIPVFEYTPTEIKSATCGYGHAGKDQVSSMVSTLLNLPQGLIVSRDATDALAVSVCHTSSRRMKGVML